jgi:uncharacterized protein (TIGR03067 family)
MMSLLLGLAVTVAAPGPKEPPKKEPPTLVGDWVIDSLTIGAEKFAEIHGTFTFKPDGKCESKLDGQKSFTTGAYTIDMKKEPPTIDLQEGPDKPSKGIFKIDGDTLTMCFPLTDSPRPTKFEAGESINVLMVLKRVKKD